MSWFAKEELGRRKKFCEKIMENLDTDPYAFIKEQISWLNLKAKLEFREENFVGHSKMLENQENFEKFLDSMLGKQMDKECQEESRSKFRRIRT